MVVMSSFKATGISYLVRRNCGTYYWQAKIGGASRRGSLRTKAQSVAKARIGNAMAKAKARFESVAAFGGEGADVVTVGEWVGEWLRREVERVGIKDSTRKDYRNKSLALMKCELADIVLRKVTVKEVRDWWRKEVASVSPVTANQRLRVLKCVFSLGCKSLGILFDPVADMKRVPVPKKLKAVVEVDLIRSLARNVRSQGKSHSREAAAMIEVAAFSGMRPAEVAALRAEDFQEGWVAVKGGKEGTKNRSERLVPINPELAGVVEREGWDERVGPLFTILTPYRALVSACARLEVETVTPYDLRHFFATTCIERGIDLATVAEWLGHKDGGVLLLQTYTHVRRAHSASQAARLRFD